MSRVQYSEQVHGGREFFHDCIVSGDADRLTQTVSEIAYRAGFLAGVQIVCKLGRPSERLERLLRKHRSRVRKECGINTVACGHGYQERVGLAGGPYCMSLASHARGVYQAVAYAEYFCRDHVVDRQELPGIFSRWATASHEWANRPVSRETMSYPPRPEEYL